ncbi:MAG: Gfo/Idh/MocA family oxidoreductase [Ruminococcaceae bacterium]|nr:Gfo/Idh/MocA family oxidoreductase [Oscillospiraceae bacterium]
MKEDIKIGLIGFGAMGKVHSYAVSNLKYFYSPLPFRATLCGVCTTSPERSEEIAQLYGFDAAYKNAEEIIARDDIDVIDICTPNLFHYSVLRSAILAGKSIYCEKPLCLTYAEAKEIAALAKEHNTICNVAFNNRHIAPILRAKEIISKGDIGRILSFSCEYLHNSALDANKPAGWKQRREICGGGALVDLGAHCIDLVYFLCGRFDSVSGRSQIAFPTRVGADGKEWQTNADEAFYMHCRMRSGACGTISVSKIAAGTNDDLNIVIRGDKGALSFSLMQPNYLRYYDGRVKTPTLGGYSGFTDIECVGRYPAPAGGFPSPKSASSWLRGHVQSIYDFLYSVHTEAKTQPDFSDGAYVQAVIEAGYLSDTERKSVDISEIDKEL